MPPPKTFLWAVLISAVFSAVLIQRSIHLGPLSVPPTYDDVTYYADAADRLRTLYEGGPRSLLIDWAQRPPRAPGTTLTSLVGFLIFGLHPWAPLLTNGLMLAILIGFFLMVASPLPPVQSMLLAIAFLGFPLFAVIVLDSRPDGICAMLTAIGICALIQFPIGGARLRRDIVVGLPFGLALLWKPTVFHVTLALLGVALGVSVIRALLTRVPASRILASGIVVIGTTILVALPHYAVSVGATIAYIHENVFGAKAAVWTGSLASASLRDHLLFYLSGAEGRITLGVWLYPSCALVTATFLTSWLLGDRRALTDVGLATLMTVIAYAVVTAVSFKGPHGQVFAAMVVCLTGISAIKLAAYLSRYRPELSWLFCGVLVSYSVLTYDWIGTWRHGTSIPAPYAHSRWEILHRVVEALENRPLERRRILFTGSAPYLNQQTVRLEFAKRKLKMPITQDILFHESMTEFANGISQADTVVAFSPDAGDVISWLPSTRARDRILELLNASGSFELTQEIPDREKGGAILIFDRSGSGFRG